MKTKAVVGLDAAQAGVCYHLEDMAGCCLARGEAPKSRAGWKLLERTLQAHGLEWEQCLVAIEATGHHHLPWCEACTQAGASVLALNPLVARRTTPVRNAIRDQKADAIDAEGLACTARREGAALERFRYRADSAGLALRRLVSSYQIVRRSLTNLKKHAGSLGELGFPELGGLKLGEGQQRRLLQRAATPARIAALTAGQLRQLVDEKALPLRAIAQESFAPAALAEACAPCLQTLLGLIEHIEGVLRQLAARMHEQAARAVSPQQLALARTLPGFGPRTAPVLLAFVPAELWTRKQPRKKKVARLQALFGLDPRVRSSGTWRGTVKVSKRGCRFARTALYQIAFCSLAHDPCMLAYYRHLREHRHKSHKAALVDLARKHLRRLVAVLESGRPFLPHQLPAAA